MTRRFSTEITLESLCYALYQASTSEIAVTRDVNSDAEQKMQLRELAEEIVFAIEEWGVDEVMLENIKWFDKDLILKALGK